MPEAEHSIELFEDKKSGHHKKINGVCEEHHPSNVISQRPIKSIKGKQDEQEAPKKGQCSCIDEELSGEGQRGARALSDARN